MIKPLHPTSKKPAPQGAINRAPMHRRPLAQWIATALAMSAMHAHAGGPPLSQSWLASQRGTATGNQQSAGTPGSAGIPGLSPLTATQAQQQQSVQQALQNLNRAAQAVATQLSNQQAAQQAAQALAGSPVPDGIAAGGLQVAAGIGTNPALWQNANAPTQSVSNGQTQVEVKQTAQKAILTWDSFNVGRHTTLHFDQTSGTQTDGSNNWIALNRINDPSGKPSQIFGQIKAEGSVYLINRNGILFGAGSQVNTHSLLATSMNLFSSDVNTSNTFFLQNGIAQTSDPNHVLGPNTVVSAFLVDGSTVNSQTGNASVSGSITVEKGASIQTQPQGFTLIAAPVIQQSGSIIADGGAAILASTDSLKYVAPAQGGNGMFSVARGDTGVRTNVWPGYIENDGIVEARRGEVQWIGTSMIQNGVLVASTTLSQPGQLILTGIVIGTTTSSIELGAGSVTTVLPEKDGETTSSSQAADQAFQTSSITLTANQSIVLDQGALIEAPSGNVNLQLIPDSANTGGNTRIYLDHGAIIDVSGLTDVELPMSALLVSIPRVGQNELADSPLLRNSFLYTQKNVVVDSTQSGTRADGLDWVGSPVLNAAGYVENVPRTIDQLMLKGGSITLAADEVVTRTGSQLRLDGGYLNYLPGWITTPNLLGADGRIYNIASADPNMDYVGFAGQYNDSHARWGVSDVYTNPLLSGMVRYDNGFIQGADAGTLTIGSTAVQGGAVLDGELSAQAYRGRNQVSQGMAPSGGTLSIISGDVFAPGGSIPVNYDIVDVTTPIETINPLFDDTTPWGDPNGPGAPDSNRFLLSAQIIERGGFSKFKISTTGTIDDDASQLKLQPGGEVDFTATGIKVDGLVQVTSGTINLTQIGPDGIVIGSDATLDASGLWSNDSGASADDMVGTQYINGGTINLTAMLGGSTTNDVTGDIVLEKGSVLNVSSGGHVQQDGLVDVANDVPLGRGGNITLATHVLGSASLTQPLPNLLGGALHLDGTLLGYGFSGGGSLTLEAAQIQIGGTPDPSPDVSLLYLPTSFFTGQGFASYQLKSETDADIATGSNVLVKPANLLPNYAALAAAPTGSDIRAGNLTQVGYLDDYHRWLTSAGSDQPAGIAITAGLVDSWSPSGPLPIYQGVNGAINLGEGATLQVDPGASVQLQAYHSLTILGSIIAPGGVIDLSSKGDIKDRFAAPNRALWLGANSLLDASGISLINPMATATASGLGDGFVPRTGTVLDGGEVDLSADQYLVAQQGARIDVSGASDTYELPSAQTLLGAPVAAVAQTPVWSDGGSINLSAGGGMYVDASFSAQAGSAQGLGGSLSISALNAVSQAQPTARAIILQQSGDLLPTDLKPGDDLTGIDASPGLLHFVVDRLQDSGIANFAMGPTAGDNDSQIKYAPVPVLFSGNVSLDLPRSVVINTSTLATIPAGSSALPTGAIDGAGKVSIEAPYVFLANSAATTGNTPNSVPGDGTLDVQASFIDMGGQLTLEGFQDAAFHSSGDLRFYLPPLDVYVDNVPRTGWLYSTGNLDFYATRMYPVSDYGFLIDVVAPAGQESTVTFHGNGTSDSSTPLSAGGGLAVAASHIVQDGVLWVPSGSITLGVSDAAAERAALGLSSSFALPDTQSVQLTPTSVTSVSLGGATLPFGSTIDGKEWRYDGDPLNDATDISAPPAKQISIHGDQVSLQQGATVDVSGGGDLQAFEWIPGTGGSRDVLAQSQTSFADGSTGVQQPQYPDGRAIYAIIPGYNAPVAAHDAALEKGAGADPNLGQAVYLSGIPGLPAGVYTLLPARYATLPGAYRVVQDTSSQDAVLGRNAALPDGTQMVAGYFVDALTGARSARTTTFELQSGAVWQQYSQYTLTSANQFFGALAEHAGTVAAQLPQDAGHLLLDAGHELDLGASLTAGTGEGGRGAQVDIAGQAIQILGVGEQALDGYLAIDADGLTHLGASSLLIGGSRSASDEGDVVDAQAQSIVLSNDAAHPLAGSEIILVTNGTGSGIEANAGSVLRGTGDATGLNGVPLIIGKLADDTGPAISGDGALLRVSSGDASPVIRRDVTGIDGPDGVAGGALSIADGATIDGGNALTLDATGNTQVGASALISAKNIDVTANRIAFVGDATPDDTSGMLIGTATLGQFSGADSIVLRSRSTIDFVGDIDINLQHNLELDGPSLTSDGGTVDIAAAKLTLGNDIGSTDTFAAGQGHLQIHAGEMDLGDGAFTLRGFGDVQADATQGIVAQGSGNFDFGSLNVTMNTPSVVVATGAATTVHTTGALAFDHLDGTALASTVQGGKLTLSGGTVLLDTAFTAPAGTVDVDATGGDLTIGDNARLSVAGLSKTFNDVQSFAPGGALVLDASAGNLSIASGATLDISADKDGGNAGSLTAQASGQARIQGQLLGTAADGYLGGNVIVDTGGAFDLDAFAQTLASSGITGSIVVRTGAGDLDLAAGHTLTAHQVSLTANGDAASGGWVHIDGTVDASGSFGGPIDLYGKGGVDVEGSLLSFAFAKGSEGGDISIGTSGTGDGTLNANYGYENVQAADSGTIILGPRALIKMDGDGGDGSLSLRAPLLVDGDVNVTVADGAQIVGAKNVVLEAYATWSTEDNSSDPSKHFDGLIDPAGWYIPDPGTGKPTLVAGHFVDASGTQQPDPDFSDESQLASYFAKYFFVPDTGATDAAHQGFYGYVNGDPSQGPGALMGFVQAPGFTFASRFASIKNFSIRPGIDLVNPDTKFNDGDIAVLSNWNLGAGIQNADGSLALAYRYGGQAPILTLRAENNLDIRASITDGFFQGNNILGAGTVPVATYCEASAAWVQLQNQLFLEDGITPDDVPGVFSAPTKVSGTDQVAVGEYYGQYVAYADYLDTPVTDTSSPITGFSPLTPEAFWGFGIVTSVTAPTAPTAPVNLNEYPAYLASFKGYLDQSAIAGGFPGAMPDTFVPLIAPPTTLDRITPPPPVTDNSPSPEATANNGLPLLSASLVQGNSSSYRLVAGADTQSVDPLAVQAIHAVQGNGSAVGQVSFDGHTDYLDPNTGHVIYTPTLIRTGNGDIDIAAAGDVRWLDTTAPAAIYSAGVPLDPTVKPSVSLLQPTGEAELVVTNQVNPIDGGNISIHAGGDIVGVQSVVDTDGSATGTPGTSIAQYWWPWMQTGNAADGSRSSLNFGAFDQGVMASSGNVDISAGGDIRQLSVSLPTTWYLGTAADGSQVVTTVGGGNLHVKAGGDILSGSYFVARGTGDIQVGGSIGSDFNFKLASFNNGTLSTVDTPVSTIFALQDAQLDVSAGGSIDIGGVYNPSWLDMTLNSTLDSELPAGHFDGQSFSAASSLSVRSAGGDIDFGSLSNALALFVPSTNSFPNPGPAGFVLPATVELDAPNGNLNLTSSGELYPSADGNLTLLAGDSILFNHPLINTSSNSEAAWGLIDAPASLLPSVLNTNALTSPDNVFGVVRRQGYLFGSGDVWPSVESFVHQSQPLHGDDEQPVRIYALNGDIVDGAGGGLDGVFLVPNKPASIQAGRDIVDLAFIGQQTHDSDVTRIVAGRDIIDTSPTVNNGLTSIQEIIPVIALGGPGTLEVQAGRDIGPFASQADLLDIASTVVPQGLVLNGDTVTGIDTIGNALNPYLPHNGANVQVLYGVAPGMDQAAFIAQYVDPSAGVQGVPSLTPDLVSFMDSYVAGQVVDTGLAKDQVQVSLSADQAWAQFQTLPSYVQQIFVQKALFKILATVGTDYNDPTSPFNGQYARGYAALSTLFPASLGYTDNGNGQGGINGAAHTVDTGDLDIRNTTIQTQQGGDVALLAPGGQALLGSSSAPPILTNALGQVVAGPNTMGLLTLRTGDIDIFTDRSVQLAQSRIFTEQGGDIVAWSSNGDINAGKGAKTTSEIPPISFICDLDAYCLVNPSGAVSGAGIATLQTVAGAPIGNAFLMAPRGTVDAGDAGIRVSGNLVVAAAQVANADNIQVQGEKIGVPVAQSVNIGALSAASAAAGAVSHVAEDMANKQRDDARGQQPSVISVHVLGFGEDSSSVQGVPGSNGYDAGSPVQVLGAGHLTSAKRKALTVAEQQRLSE